MGDKLYVGGLPYSATDAQLQKLFVSYEIVRSANIIVDKFTGRSRGFGFVEMSSADEARAAMEALNGTELEGRTLVVDKVHARSDGALQRVTAHPPMTSYRQKRRKSRRYIIRS